MYRVSFITLFVVIHFFSEAQTINRFAVDYRGHYGFMISHSPTMRYITRNHFLLHELAFNWQSSGINEWERAFKYPSYGCTFLYSNLDNNPFFGKTGGLASHINFNIAKTNLFHSVFKLGLGLSYTQNIYHPENNYKNTALATRINALILLHFNQSFRITENTSFDLGFGLTHYSNGNFKKPNRGINIATVNTGLTYKWGKQEYVNKIDTVYLNHVYYIFRVGTGPKEIYPPLGKKYLGLTVSNYLNYALSSKNNWFAGLDYFYDNSLLDELNKDSVISKNILYNHRLGWFAGYCLSISKLAIEMGWGYYVWSKFKLDGKHYQRIGLRYTFNNGYFVNMTLKTHFANADYVEWGLGYVLKNKLK